MIRTSLHPLTLFGTPKFWCDFYKNFYLFQSHTGVTAVTANNDPIGYAKDIGGSSNNLTQSSAGNKPAYTLASKCATFDGTNDYMLFPSRILFSGGMAVFSIFKTTSTKNTSGSIISPAEPIIGDASGSVTICFGIHDSKFRMTHYNGAIWTSHDGSRSLNDGNWHSIFVNYEKKSPASSSTYTVYIDGTLEIGPSTEYYDGTSEGLGYVGINYPSSDYFHGSIRELWGLNRHLTTSEVTIINAYAAKAILLLPCI